MKTTLWFMTPVILSICLVGCAKNDSGHNEQTTFFEFQIVLRQGLLAEEPSVTPGPVSVLSRHEIPVHIGMEHEEATSITDNIWIDFRWNKSELLSDRLKLHGLQYRIRNNMFYNGSGSRLDWASIPLHLSSDWRIVKTPVDVSRTQAGPMLYHRIAWLNSSLSVPDIEMTELVQETNEGKS